MIFDTSVEQPVPFPGGLPLPEIAVIIAIIFSTYGCVVLRQLVCEKNYDSVMINGLNMFIGGGLALVHSLLVDAWNPLPVTNMQGFLMSAGGMLFVSNIVGSSAYIELLKRYSITFLSFTAFSEPLLTALLDWLIFGTKMPSMFYLSVAIVFVGLYLFYSDELKRHSKPAL